MTDQELKDLVASLAKSQQKTEAAQRKTKAEQQKTARAIRELGKQIGGLGNKFGSYTEGIAMPSVRMLLLKRFGVEDFSQNRIKRSGADSLELDTLGMVNGSRREAYIVEVRSNLRSEDIAQLKTTLDRFRHLYPEYTEYKAFGILAVSKASECTLEQAWQEGFYVMGFDDTLLRFHELEGFLAKVF